MGVAFGQPPYGFTGPVDEALHEQLELSHVVPDGQESGLTHLHVQLVVFQLSLAGHEDGLTQMHEHLVGSQEFVPEENAYG